MFLAQVDPGIVFLICTNVRIQNVFPKTFLYLISANNFNQYLLQWCDSPLRDEGWMRIIHLFFTKIELFSFLISTRKAYTDKSTSKLYCQLFCQCSVIHLVLCDPVTVSKLPTPPLTVLKDLFSGPFRWWFQHFCAKYSRGQHFLPFY